MSRLTIQICIASLCVLAVSSLPAGALPPLPAMACPLITTAEAPQLDGALDEPVWSQADVQTQFHRWFGGLDRPQDFRLLSDGEWLYLGVTAYEQGIGEQDTENLSVFVAPHKASDQFVTFAVTMNAQGITTSRPPILDADGKDWRAAFQQHADRWVVEIAIRTTPVFGDTVTKGQVFDFNLSRTRSRIVGDSFDVYQQWSNTGTSSGSRYRFGEVSFGSPADRIPVIRGELQRELEIARGESAGISDAARQAFSQAEQDAEALLAASPGEGVVSTAAVQEYQRQANALKRTLRRAILAERGTIVWACNPMTVPLPSDLPSADQEDAARLDIRVLAGEWESAALVVTNLTPQTLDGQVLLTDFVAGDGETKVPGWDILQVRTAPLYLLHTGRKKRDPLPKLQEGDLFRVAPDENELLWLTFKSRDIAPGRYTATLTVRSLDDQVSGEVELVLRVYPLALGAEGRPRVNPWNSMLRGKDWAERAAHCRDYYINCAVVTSWDETPVFPADAEGNLLSDTLASAKYDHALDQYLQSGVDMYLLTIETHKYRFWPVRREGGYKWHEAGATEFNFERWSPRFNELFAKWVVAFRDYMAQKGLPPDRWAFYIMDEPAVGEERQDVIEFARQVKQADPQVMTYVTLPMSRGDDAEILEVSRYVDFIQGIGQAKPEVMAAVRANAKELWSYSICLRGENPFDSYRRGVCWEPLRRGDVGTGFWVWDSQGQSDFMWRDANRPLGVKFAVLYNHHDNTIVPSLRTEAFREGIEDWKYVLMLDEAIARAQQEGVDRAVVAAAQAYRVRCLDELDDADSAYRFRDAARSHLLALHVALGDINPHEVSAIEQD